MKSIRLVISIALFGLFLSTSIRAENPPLPQSVVEVFDELSLCEMNGSSSIRKFDPVGFNPASIRKKIRREDGDAMGIDCRHGRKYGVSKEDSASKFLALMRANEWIRECFIEDQEYGKSRYEQLLVKTEQLLKDSANIGIFTSLFTDKNDNSEGCMYYDLYIYRNDGFYLAVTFNMTD